MRISDWSSDFCSSDLFPHAESRSRYRSRTSRQTLKGRTAPSAERRSKGPRPYGRSPDRKSVVQGKRESVRVDIGGRRIIKKKSNQVLNAYRTSLHVHISSRRIIINKT